MIKKSTTVHQADVFRESGTATTLSYLIFNSAELSGNASGERVNRMRG